MCYARLPAWPGLDPSKGGQENFFVSPQIANPQILGLILQSQIRNFWGVSVRKSQIRELQNIYGPQITKSANYLL